MPLNRAVKLSLPVGQPHVYCIYSAGDFEVLCPAGATRFTEREIWHGGLFHPAGANPLTDVNEICRVYVGNRSTKAINIWRDSLKLGNLQAKTRCGIPPNFRSPLAPKLLVGLKNQGGCKNGTDILCLFIQSLVEICRCTAA